MSGARSHHAGLAAEEAVIRHFAALGARVAARRWRSAAGEIDIVMREASGLLFIEVKQARSHAAAAWRLTARQRDRICQSALAFLEGEPQGQFTPARYELAVVDAQGRVALVPGAFSA